MFDLSYYMPTKIIYGKNCIENNAEVLKSYGKKCLIITGKNSAKQSGALGDIIAALVSNQISYEIFDEVTQNPLLSICVKGGKFAKNVDADFLIGIGGGSVMDATKAMALFAKNEIEPLEIFDLPQDVDKLPFILVGTTAGTGSEVTPYSVLTIDDDHRKKSVKNLFAEICFCDVRYTYSVNYSTTIATALDAFSHCVEGYFAKTSNDLSDMYAIKGSKLIIDVLIDMEDSQSFTESQREKLFVASILGGFSIAKTGTCFCHAMGYFLTEDYDIAHGTACSVFIPAYLKQAWEFETSKMNTLIFELDCTLSALKNIVESYTIYDKIELTESQKKELYERWNGSKNFAMSPGEFDVDDAMEIVENLF